MEHYTRKGLSNCCSSAYLRAKAKTFYKKSTQGYAAHKSVRGHYLRRPLGKDFVGLHTSKTQKRLSRHAKHARAPPHTSQIFHHCTTHPTHLAPPKMGDGPGWAVTTTARGEQVCSSSHRIFYKVDWGQTTRQNHIRDSKKIILADRNLQIRSTKKSNSWQWKTIRLRQLQTILQEYRYQDCLRLSLPPRIKWGSGKS